MIPINIHNVRCRLRALGLVFVCALLPSHKRTKISVDRCVCGLRQDINIDMIDNVHGFTTLVSMW